MSGFFKSKMRKGSALAPNEDIVSMGEKFVRGVSWFL